MDATDYLKELSYTLYQYHKEGFLCDVYIVTSDSEVAAHSIILSTASAKLKVAFAKSESIKLSHVFKLYMSDFTTADVEIVLQFVYTGTIDLAETVPYDYVRTVLAVGQKLGLDSVKLAGVLGALLCFSDESK